MRREFKYLNETRFNLLCKKGIFPYDYVDSVKKLTEKKLMSKNTFKKNWHSHISEDKYNHSKTIWFEFSIENLGECSDLYMKTDIILLADILKKNMSWNIFFGFSMILYSSRVFLGLYA